MQSLQRKVKRALEERIDTPDLIATLKHLSSFYGENTLENRRNLRNVLEKRGQSLNNEFVSSFEEIVESFEKVSNSVDALSKECQYIESILNECKLATNDLLTTTNELRSKKSAIESKEDLVGSFLNRFELNEKERNVYNIFINNKNKSDDGTGEIDDDNTLSNNNMTRELIRYDDFEIFKVFYRMKQIRSDCQRLLTHYYQKASLDILDKFGKMLENWFVPSNLLFLF